DRFVTSSAVKRLLLLGIGLLMATLVATGGSASRTLRPRVGFVAYAGSVPTRHTLGGLAFVGFVQAERKLPIQGRVKFISPTQGPRAVLETFGRQGYDLVISPLFDSQAVGPVARRFPRVQFLVIDAQPGSPPKAHAKNIHRAVFRAEQAAYLAGYLSALMAGRQGGRHMISAVGGYRFYGVTR